MAIIYSILFFSIFGASFLSLVGLIAGIWAEKFDNMSGITNFIITPLTFLSGTFYSIDRLPEPFYTISLFNPFYYKNEAGQFVCAFVAEMKNCNTYGGVHGGVLMTFADFSLCMAATNHYNKEKDEVININ